MTSNADEFQRKVREFSIGAATLPERAVRDIGIDALGRLVDRTPVGQPEIWADPTSAPPGYVGGRARGNWQVSFTDPAQGVVPDIDPNGQGTKAKGEAALAKNEDPYPLIWLTNNLPYIERLEDGWSKQAAAGMLSPTFAELEIIAQGLVDAIVAQFEGEARP